MVSADLSYSLSSRLFIVFGPRWEVSGNGSHRAPHCVGHMRTVCKHVETIAYDYIHAGHISIVIRDLGPTPDFEYRYVASYTQIWMSRPPLEENGSEPHAQAGTC